MARYLTQQHRDDGREVEVADLQGPEVVERREEDGQRGVDPDDPREREHVVRRRQQDRGLHNDLDYPHASLWEGVAHMAGAELRDTEHAGDSTAQGWLFCGRDASVVVRLVDKEHGEEQDGARLSRVHPEGGRPRLEGRHEGREERAHVGAHDEEGRPDVDLARALVEEEHVLDKHHPAALGDGREEAIEDACAHEGLEGIGTCAPCSGSKGHDEEVESHWETSKVRREHDSCGGSLVSEGPRLRPARVWRHVPNMPPAPNMKTFPACEWFTSSGVMFHSLQPY